ncbi:MAG: helix-turn-helix domain-containing protein [Pseudomonadota bacterium]
MERHDTADIFRQRLAEAIARTGIKGAELARRSGIDRSTLSQLRSLGDDRLPRADTVAGLAVALRVSADWLLGLSQEAARGADILQQVLQIELTDRSPADESLARWHAEAAGYKVRYVPASLPDMLKTEEVLYYEYRDFHTVGTKQAIARAHAHLAYSRLPETDIEVCTTVQAVEGLAGGEGIWRGLEPAARQRQLRHMSDLVDELYPSFRWYCFDGLKRYSAPFTVFGPLRAAIYVGQMYFVFSTPDHIRVLARHFDDLIRAALVPPPEIGKFLRRLVERVPGADHMARDGVP